MADARYDPVHGWRGLTAHRHFRFAGSGGRGGDAVTDFLRGAGMTVLDGDPSRLNLRGIRFDTFLVANLAMSGLTVRWERDRPAAQRRFMFLMVSRGVVEIVGHGPQHCAPEGGILIVFPGDQPVELIARRPADLLVFTFDVGEVSPLTLSPENIRTLSPGSSVFRSSYAYLHALAHTADELDHALSPVAKTLTREVARVLIASASTPELPDIYDRAQAMITSEHRDPELVPDSIAAALGTSRSSLGRAFARRGSSVARDLRRHRAVTARQLLRSEPGIAAQALAHRSGFGSSTALHRALLGEFGLALAALRVADLPAPHPLRAVGATTSGEPG